MLSPIVTRPVTPEDVPHISALHDRVFGPGRFARTAYRVREGLSDGDASRYCRCAMDGDRLIAALRMSEIAIGGTSGALLLGPLVVAPEYGGRGYGHGLIREAIAAARADGLKLIVLIGDEPYYGRLGFRPVPPGTMTFPGPVDPNRILALELQDGALAQYSGAISGR
ncbi:GCN5 family acetyltransferase [Hyphomicrobium nitrativorans NL23]|uniref:GCN5 family acetyltransferase n=1 Tax=Hyphomicrobium nitrativorans NL23 TaxID=1029756 RepID=V5SD25_9HYPH|nr:N-acetyltransferase [Hyphomicrobium nitrativorans]AHB48428.1 GCN5 family acetyltransferase [Hyphomicrobium nitrativorans NL23]